MEWHTTHTHMNIHSGTDMFAHTHTHTHTHEMSTYFKCVAPQVYVKLFCSEPPHPTLEHRKR